MQAFAFPHIPPSLLPRPCRRVFLRLCTAAVLAASSPARPRPPALASFEYDESTAQTYEKLDGNTVLTNKMGLDELRSQLISNAHGDVLELGFGTGVNLPYYSFNNKVNDLTALDKSSAMLAYAARKKKLFSFTPVIADATNTRLPSNSFDTVVSTFCLCVVSESQVHKLVDEMHRLVKTGGTILILDYTKSKQFRPIALYQDLTADAVTKLSKGCRPNLDLLSIFSNDERFSVISSRSIVAGTITALQLSTSA